MSKDEKTSTKVNDQPEMATKYRFKKGAKEVLHKVLGVITLEHLQGPKAEVIIKAIKKCDANKPDHIHYTNNFFGTFIEEVK
jgi:hypothetical protein